MHIIKKYIPVFLSFILIVSSLSVTAVVFANDIDYYYDESTATLHITGSGAMDDYADEYSAPWRTYSQSAKKIIMEDGITAVGSYSFAGFKNVSSVEIPDSVKTIGSSVFASCTSLKELTLSPNITKIADSSFAFGKEDFVVNAESGSFALFFAVKNNIDFNCNEMEFSDFKVRIVKPGMHAYYPIKPKHDCTVTFASTGSYYTKCFIYDSNFNRLLTGDGNGDGLNFRVSYSFKAGETYYFDALMWDTGDTCTYNVNVNVDSFEYKVSAYAMADPSGEPSNITIDELLVNGSEIGSGTVISFSESPASLDITLNGRTSKIFVTPNSDTRLVLPTCDVNNDGYVNAKDFAVMKKENSKYLPLFDKFINYKL